MDDQHVFVLEVTDFMTGEMVVHSVYPSLDEVVNIGAPNFMSGISSMNLRYVWRKSENPLLYTTAFRAPEGYVKLRITKHAIYSYP